MTEKSCVPSFNLIYRLLYIFFSLVFSTLVFKSFFLKISALNDNFQIAFYGFAILFVVQIAYQLFTLNKKFLDYLGNLMTVLLASSFLTLHFLSLKISPKFSFYIMFFLMIMMYVELYRRYLMLKK